MGNIKITTAEKITRKMCEFHPGKLFIFGENVGTQKRGETMEGGGQAIIRGMPNSYGFCTLNEIHDYWTDFTYAANSKQIIADIDAIKKMSKNFPDGIVFPKYGLGTGRAHLHITAPKTFFFMCIALYDTFGYNNIAGMEVPKF